ncbi:MAG: UDP-glucose/GDP-mannose dehydrogenase family protein [Burkholderiales bacterium]|nr:UDP-glucose/GDP-mannose dehydrogenase family protein [Burkholderiales bacterium]
MKIAVFGTGYVGLVQGAVLADAGHTVICVDIDENKLARLRKGEIPIFEPGLEPIVKSNFAEGRLLFTSDAKEAIEQSEVQFIAVGTPPNEDGSADLKHVLAVAKTIATHMTGYTVVVDKSTVPVGTADKVTDMIAQTLKARGVDFAFDVVSNPEFLKEGAAVADCQRPDRIVIGTESAQAENTLRELYEPFNRNHDKVIVMNVRSAELTKYAANCMLATKISFMNEMANIAELVGADIESVRQGIGSDQRIGYHFIYPGAGYGGSCFPKDVSALVKTSEGLGYTPWILNAVESRNQAQKHVVFEKIQRYFKDALKNKTFALWGLSFKPNTDDMREAPSRVVMEALWQAGARVQAFDPAAMEETQHIYGDRPDLMLCGTKEAALMGADALVIMTEWKNFRVPDFERMKSALKTPAIFDGRNLFEPARMRERGFDYFSIGR